MEIRQIVENMTLEEKAGMCSGGDFWHTQAVKRLDIPAVAVSDGPHGLWRLSASPRRARQPVLLTGN